MQVLKNVCLRARFSVHWQWGKVNPFSFDSKHLMVPRRFMYATASLVTIGAQHVFILESHIFLGELHGEWSILVFDAESG